AEVAVPVVPSEATPQPEPTHFLTPQFAEPTHTSELDAGLDSEPVSDLAVDPLESAAAENASALLEPAIVGPPAQMEAPHEDPQAMGANPNVLRSQLLTDFDSYLARILATLEALADRSKPHSSSPDLAGVAADDLAGDRSGRHQDRHQRSHPIPERLTPVPTSASATEKARRPGPQLPSLPSPHTHLQELRAQVTHLLSEPLPVDSDRQDAGPGEFPSNQSDSHWETETAPLANRAPLAPPHLEISTDPVAGQTTRVRVQLPANSEADTVKLWLLDGNSSLLLDGPQRISRFTRNPQGDREAVTHFKMPFGCLVARLEAIALQDSSDRASSRAAIERCVSLPNIRRSRPIHPVAYLPKTSS
ncbi:MAG: hypothetical protein AAFY11_14870, partial [Cyanobacteria bacterium J06641_5]